MNSILKVTLLVIGIVVLCPAAECRTAPPQCDSLVLQLCFRPGDNMLLRDYRENNSSLQTLRTLLSGKSVGQISLVRIVGSAFPEDNLHRNEALLLQRAKNVWSYIFWKVPALNRDLVQVSADTDFCAAWFYAVEKDLQVPCRDQVLEILRSDASVATKWANVQLLEGDAAHYLEQMIFPDLRNSVSCVVRMKSTNQQQTTKIPSDTASLVVRGAADTCALKSEVPATAVIAIADSTSIANTPEQTASETAIPEPAATPASESEIPATVVDTTAESAIPTLSIINASEPISSDSADEGLTSNAGHLESPLLSTAERKPLFALKTNLLFDAATMLNLAVEVPIGQRWSVAGELIIPWWLWKQKQHCLELMNINVEGKYWFGDRTNCPQLTGWFAGVYAGGGYYDLEWNRTGYQGEFFIAAGVSGGYAHTINKCGNLRMEYSLGIGYMQTNYRKYEAKIGSDDAWHLYRRADGKYKWFGPTSVKISLVWMLPHKQKGGSK